MKTLSVLLFCFLVVSAQAAPLSILGFKSDKITIYKSDGSRDKSVNTKKFGNPKSMRLKGILDNGLYVLQSGNEELVVDPFDLKFPPGTNINEEDLKAVVGQGFDSNAYGVNGIGGD